MSEREKKEVADCGNLFFFDETAVAMLLTSSLHGPLVHSRR
jgi:hypothetical protein